MFTSQTSTPSSAQNCLPALLCGYTTSADTGNEDLVISSRAALTSFCSSAPNRAAVCAALVDNLRLYSGSDRVIVPTLEVIAFLFHVGLFGSGDYDYRPLCLRIQKAGYKSGNVRKLEACVRVYGAVAGLESSSEGVMEARKRLGALLLHPWPRVRSVVVDELWGLMVVRGEEQRTEKLLGVDWGNAERSAVKGLVEGLGLI